MIHVVVDDLAFVAADAVVRPADAVLDPVTPAASRLDRMAGPRFAEQRRVASPLEPGAAVVTGAGDLSAPFVVHVVIRAPGTAPGPDVVRRALVSAWQRAGDWGLDTVAARFIFPGVSLEAREMWLLRSSPLDTA